jgi:hypothetical protein
MKKLFLLLSALAAAAALHAQSETINLGSRGKLTLYFPDRWQVDTQDYGDRRFVSVKPKDDTNAECQLNITFPETDRFDTKARLKMRVEIDGQKFADMSVEGKAVGKPFTLGTGYGYHCDFTDPELVGKAPQKGNYKTISVGLIRLTPEILIEVSINADGFNSAAYNELLGMIEGMEFTPPKGSSI